jgi:hypothetical protein
MSFLIRLSLAVYVCIGVIVRWPITKFFDALEKGLEKINAEEEHRHRE